MKKFLSNYKSTIILLVAIIVGSIIGIIFKEKATILSPLGDLFLNLLLVIIIPLIFLNITTAISKMKQPKRIEKIIGSILLVFVLTSIVAVLIGFASTYFVKLINTEDGEQIRATLESAEDVADTESTEEDDMTIADRTVKLLTVNDFSKLFSKDNIIALLVFSIIVGIAINMSGEKGEPFRKVLESANSVMENIVKIIMYYAPIGLGCYMASFIGSFGTSIAVGYLKTFLVYLVVAILYYFVMYSVYAFIANGKKGVKDFWKNVIPATVTAMGTCSSAACIPINIESTKKMGVPDDIAETTIPLGTSFHKDGSIIGSVFKIMFLVGLFGTSLATTGDVLGVLGVALLANLLITAVPIGGGTISEMLIITMLGYPVAVLPILTIIATIIDMPATVLNVVGDDVSSMMVTRMVDGKNAFQSEEK